MKELDLIAGTPSAVRMKWTGYLARIKDKVWDHPLIAMMAVFGGHLTLESNCCR